jgi:hypothetical protein
MFDMPNAAEDTNDLNREGMGDSNPVKIGQPFTVRKLDNLLAWFHR